jgi:hypothetical protein
VAWLAILVLIAAALIAGVLFLFRSGGAGRS